MSDQTEEERATELAALRVELTTEPVLADPSRTADVEAAIERLTKRGGKATRLKGEGRTG